MRDWMASGETVIQSMRAPAITNVRQQGIPCINQPLKEGYRAWAADLGIPTHVVGRTLDACYEFVNRFLSGWAGAFLNRQGYYTAMLDTAKENMTAGKWGYWMEGKPCAEAIKSPTGEELAKPGRSATVAPSTSAWARSPPGTP